MRLSHRAEDVLNDLRKGEVQLNKRMIDALLSARDQLGRMLADIRQGGLKEYAIDPLIAELAAVRKAAADPRASGGNAGGGSHHPARHVASALPPQAASPEHSKLGELLVEEGPVRGADVGDALVRQKQASEPHAASAADRTMRVDVRKLDELINLVGELVLERNRLMRLTSDIRGGRLSPEDPELSSQPVHGSA